MDLSTFYEEQIWIFLLNNIIINLIDVNTLKNAQVS